MYMQSNWCSTDTCTISILLKIPLQKNLLFAAKCEAEFLKEFPSAFPKQVAVSPMYCLYCSLPTHLPFLVMPCPAIALVHGYSSLSFIPHVVLMLGLVSLLSQQAEIMKNQPVPCSLHGSAKLLRPEVASLCVCLTSAGSTVEALLSGPLLSFFVLSPIHFSGVGCNQGVVKYRYKFDDSLVVSYKEFYFTFISLYFHAETPPPPPPGLHA